MLLGRKCTDVKDAYQIKDEIEKFLYLYGYITVSEFFYANGLNDDKMIPPSDIPMDSWLNHYGWKEGVDINISNVDYHWCVKMDVPKHLDLSVSTEETEDENDLVNHPKHYISESGLETIDVIEAWTKDLTGVEATDTGNIIKYISRWKHKNGLQDLEKAQWYLNHLIKKVKEKECK